MVLLSTREKSLIPLHHNSKALKSLLDAAKPNKIIKSNSFIDFEMYYRKYVQLA